MNHQIWKKSCIKKYRYHIWLVVWNMFYVPEYGIHGILLPIDFQILQDG